MAQFEELQQLWQQQPESPVTPRDAESLASGLRKYRQRQDLINGGKALLLIAQVVWILVRTHHDPMIMYGAFLADVGIVNLLLREWRKQRAASRLDFAASSIDFLRNAVERLERLRNPFQGRHWYILLAAYWVGTGLMMHKSSWVVRAVYGALPLLIQRPGVYLRAKRWNHECGPVVARMKELIAAAEENRTWTAR